MTTDFSAASRSARGVAGPSAPTDAVPASDCPNVLARNTEFTGTIEVTDSIRLEGKFQGEVTTKGTLHVVPQANVQARVEAAYVVIGGTFKGEVQCERRVDLLSDCRATGTIVTAGMTVEDGAIFDGNVVMTKRNQGGRSRQEPAESTESQD